MKDAPSWLNTFPQMDRADLRDIRKTLDSACRDFSREYGDLIESFFDPVLHFLVWFEKILISTPWWLVINLGIRLVDKEVLTPCVKLSALFLLLVPKTLY